MAKGVKAFLAASRGEMDLLDAAKKKKEQDVEKSIPESVPEEPVKLTEEVKPVVKQETIEVSAPVEPADVIPADEDVAVKKTRKKKEVAKPKSGGRPKNETYGLETRKQYSLTLPVGTYDKIFAAARKDGISFAKYMERAALEYMEKHSN